jgi:aspartyl aminopeptidase
MPYHNENSKETEEKPETLEKKLAHKQPFAWEEFDDTQKDATKVLAEDYFDFLYNARTERERTTWAIKFAEQHGFNQLEIGKDIKTLNPGDKVFYVNRKKNLVLAIIGNNPMSEGTRLIGAHIDTPRLDLKLRPLYEDAGSGVALWKTHYYGGIKKYQWATIPLHLTGVVIKKDGTTVRIEIGKDPKDPVFTIPDVLIHLSRKVQGKRTTFEVIKGEELNVLAGALPFDGENSKDVKAKFKVKVLEILHEKYDITESDLQSAELNLVSGIMPRYVGLDKSLIGAPGHDDGVCSWVGIRAIVDAKGIPPYTNLMALYDKEEIGSNGNTGAQSAWSQFVVNDLMVRTGMAETLTNLHLSLSNSVMLSADVGTAINPNFPSVHDAKNAAVLGKGPVLEKYTGARGKSGSSDASAELMAKIRNMCDTKKIHYQVVELGKVDEGGGGTIAQFFAQSFNCDVIDAGTPVINMHSPFEIIHIADLYNTYRMYKTFYEEG